MQSASTGYVDLDFRHDLLGWARDHGARIINFQPDNAQEFVSFSIDSVEAGRISPVLLQYQDELPCLIEVRNAIVPMGIGLFRACDSVVYGGPKWGVDAANPEQVLNRDLQASVLEGMVRVPSTPPAYTVPEAVFASFGSKYFGFRMLMLAGLALARGEVGNANIPIIAYKTKPDSIAEGILRRIGFDDTKIIISSKQVLVERLWVPYLPISLKPQMISSSVTTRVFRDRLGIEVENDRSRRIYISRGDAAYRRVANEKAVVKELKRYGFQAIEFAALDANDRIEAMRNAGVIVGPAGSNMINCIFAPPGAHVLELTPRTFNRISQDVVAHVCHGLRQTNSRIMCDTIANAEMKPVKRDIIVSIESLRFAVEHVLR